jgi:hypothetical protein
MRLLEGIIFLLCLLLIVLFFTENLGKTKKSVYFLGTAFVLFIIHWAVEGIRWQMYPLYLLLILCLLAVVIKETSNLNFKKVYTSNIIRRIIKSLMILFLIISMAVSYAFPVYKMPKPKGQYKVGTTTFDAVDESRKAIYSLDETKNRKIRIQMWYPSDDVKGYKAVPWLEDGQKVSNGIADMMKMPRFILSHTSLVKSNSYKEAPMSKGQEKYPIVIISHGWTGFRNLHTDLAEMLASSGYIVASIDHTYGAAATVFSDGEAAYLNRNALPSRKNKEEFLSNANTLVNTYAGDIKFTMDELQRLNGDSKIFKGKLDLDKIGLLGHSTGAGAGVTEGLRDNRVKAVMGLDAWVEPVKQEEIKIGLKVPALFLRSEQWEKSINNEHLYAVVDNSKNYKELYQINGVIHQDFTMVYMYSPLSKYLGITGKLDGWKGAELQQDFILSFFNKYLINKNTKDISEVAAKYKEVGKIR